MSIWIFLWLLLSAFLLYFMGWTMFILYRQKRAWKAFATKYKLRYKSGSMMDSAEVTGVISDYTVSVFVAQHQSADARRARKLSAVEIQLSSKMPLEGAIASGDMVPIVQDLNMKEESRPAHEGWDKDYIAASDNKKVMESYLSKERVKAISDLMSVKNSSVILIFRGDIVLLRFDTPAPLDDMKKIDQLVKKMLQTAKVMEYDVADILPAED